MSATTRESAATILRALDLGINFLDTADVYGFGDNEILVGKTIKTRRDEVFLATKFANLRKRDDPAYWGVSGRPEYVRAACDASLKRLGVDHIDLYYQHRVDPNTPIEDTVGAMADLVKTGKVKVFRSLRSLPRHHPPRPQNSPHHRAPDGILPLGASRRSRDHPHRPRSSA